MKRARVLVALLLVGCSSKGTDAQSDKRSKAHAPVESDTKDARAPALTGACKQLAQTICESSPDSLCDRVRDWVAATHSVATCKTRIAKHSERLDRQEWERERPYWKVWGERPDFVCADQTLWYASRFGLTAYCMKGPDKHGLMTKWYPNGVKQSETEYQNNRRTKSQKFWSRNGVYQGASPGTTQLRFVNAFLDANAKPVALDVYGLGGVPETPVLIAKALKFGHISGWIPVYQDKLIVVRTGNPPNPKDGKDLFSGAGMAVVTLSRAGPNPRQSIALTLRPYVRYLAARQSKTTARVVVDVSAVAANASVAVAPTLSGKKRCIQARNHSADVPAGTLSVAIHTDATCAKPPVASVHREFAAGSRTAIVLYRNPAGKTAIITADVTPKL